MLNFPVFSSKKAYKSIIHQIILTKKQMMNNLKNKKMKKITFLTPRVNRSKFEKKRRQVKCVDQITFFKKFYKFFDILRTKVENDYREFFFRVQLNDFTKVNENFKNKKIRGLR